MLWEEPMKWQKDKKNPRESTTTTKFLKLRFECSNGIEIIEILINNSNEQLEFEILTIMPF